MKQCIWCIRTEIVTPFKKQAHTIPQSLGGKNICINVCDECNSFFGQHFNKLPSIEAVIKETFNISRARFLHGTGKIGKNKPMPRFTSTFFNIDFNKHQIKLKVNSSFMHKGFQEKLCRLLKRGLYKIFLEEIERQTGDGLNPKYDFIREFSRYDLNDYPVLYFERSYGMFLTAEGWVENPEIFLKEKSMNYLIDDLQFCEFELLGHVFGIPISKSYILTLEDYLKKSLAAKSKYFKNIKVVSDLRDIDLPLRILND